MTLSFIQHSAAAVSLLVGRSLDAIVNVVFAGDKGRLLVADIDVKTFEFRIAAVYAPNIAGERRLFFRRLGSFLDASKRQQPAQFDRQVPSGSLREGDVDVDRKFARSGLTWTEC